MFSKFPKYQVASVIALIFHVIGIIGILFIDKELFIATSSIHLLLMAGLIFFTHVSVNKSLLIFFVVCFATGMLVEWYGTSTGELFGNYAYGSVLGPKFKGVPFIIGVNWFILMYCCAVSVQLFFDKIYNKVKDTIKVKKNVLHHLSLVVDAAFLAVITDYFLEPAAIKLGYWHWLGDGQIPLYNYVSWFVISACLLAVFRLLKLDTKNIFAVNLLLLQIMFFLIISSFL